MPYTPLGQLGRLVQPVQSIDGRLLRSDSVPPAALNAGRGILGYAEATSDQGSIGSTFLELTDLSVDVEVGPNRLIKVTGLLHISVNAVSDTTAQMSIGMDGQAIQRARNRPVGSSRVASLMATIVVNPDPGIRTFALFLRREVGTGTLTSHADSDNHPLILVEDVGAA